MLVTAIEQTRRGRFSVFVEGEFFCALHPDIYLFADLQPGAVITPARLEELRDASERRITRERAIRLLSGRSYTEQGLYKKLCERADERYAAAAVARMVELGLLDDADYARRYAADCVNLKGYSHRRTAQELQRKGINRDIIERTLENMEDDPEAAIARIVRRKYLRYLDEEKGVAKTINALARLGYSFSDIRAVLHNLAEDENYYEYE